MQLGRQAVCPQAAALSGTPQNHAAHALGKVSDGGRVLPQRAIAETAVLEIGRVGRLQRKRAVMVRQRLGVWGLMRQLSVRARCIVSHACCSRPPTRLWGLAYYSCRKGRGTQQVALANPPGRGARGAPAAARGWSRTVHCWGPSPRPGQSQRAPPAACGVVKHVCAYVFRLGSQACDC